MALWDRELGALRQQSSKSMETKQSFNARLVITLYHNAPDYDPGHSCISEPLGHVFHCLGVARDLNEFVPDMVMGEQCPHLSAIGAPVNLIENNLLVAACRFAGSRSKTKHRCGCYGG
jgi:hypothetical protein